MKQDVLSRDPADGLVLRLVREAGTHTRASLGEATGWARSTVTRRVDALLESGLLAMGDDASSTGGRPPEQFRFNQHAGSLIVADLGVTHSRLALVDLLGNPLEPPIDLEIDLSAGPADTLGVIQQTMKEIVERADDAPLGVGIGLPAPIDASTSLPVDPPLRFPDVVPGERDAIRVGRCVDGRDEAARHVAHATSLVFVKVGTDIDSGIVIGGDLYRGANGAAGDIGHIQLEDHADRLCSCGRNGCLEAVAGGRALAAQITALGRKAANARALVSLVQSGDSEAKSLLRRAGTHIGVVLAGAVSFADPEVIVLGGDLGIEPLLVASVRSEIQTRSLTLASGNLVVQPSRLAADAGIIGAAEHLVDRLWPAPDSHWHPTP